MNFSLTQMWLNYNTIAPPLFNSAKTQESRLPVQDGGTYYRGGNPWPGVIPLRAGIRLRFHHGVASLKPDSEMVLYIPAPGKEVEREARDQAESLLKGIVMKIEKME